METRGYGLELETVGGTPGLLAKMWKNPGKLQNFIAWSFVSFSPVSFQEISPGEGLGRVSEHLRQRLQEKPPPPFASFPRSSPRSSRLRRNLSIAAENFAPARAPPCAALSKICADLWVGASPRLPPGSSRRRPLRASPGFLPGVVGPSSGLVFFCKTSAGLGRTVGK